MLLTSISNPMSYLPFFILQITSLLNMVLIIGVLKSTEITLSYECPEDVSKGDKVYINNNDELIHAISAFHMLLPAQ